MTHFSTWLRSQVRRDDPVGDLARDAAEDKTFPRRAGIEQVHSYLRDRRASSQAIDALRKAVNEWLGWE